MCDRVDHALFITLLTEQLPEVAAEIDDIVEGLLHCEMGVLSRATRMAIAAKNWSTVEQHLAFVDSILPAATPDVVNAVYASYMEGLPLWDDDSGAAEVRALLPPHLVRVLEDMES